MRGVVSGQGVCEGEVEIARGNLEENRETM